jgi:hypothetical protein
LFLFLVSDFLYRHNVTFDNVTTEVEILDTSKCAVSARGGGGGGNLFAREKIAQFIMKIATSRRNSLCNN